MEEKIIYHLSHIANIINGVYSLILISIPLIFLLGFNVFEGTFGLVLFLLILILVGLNVISIIGTKLIGINNKKAFWFILIPNLIFLFLSIGLFIGPILGLISVFLLKNEK